MLPQIEALKELEPESSLSRYKSTKMYSSYWAFGSGNWDLEVELRKIKIIITIIQNTGMPKIRVNTRPA
jgi:hypothetical protein